MSQVPILPGARRLGAAFAGAFLAGAFLAGAALFGPASAASPKNAEVDVELVLAVDVSYSMDLDEQVLQREGYASAVTSKEFLDALKLGLTGRIAIAYVEWAGQDDQQLVVDWHIIDGLKSAQAFADAIRAAPQRRVYRTSISSALLYSADQFDLNKFDGLRRVIDVSGDGVNNQGPPVAVARDAVVLRGITINGLPLLLKSATSQAMDVPELDYYYEDCVIGGPGSFVIPIQHKSEFARAIKTKLVLEVAGVKLPDTPHPVIPVAQKEPRVSCTIGEKIWLENWSN